MKRQKGAVVAFAVMAMYPVTLPAQNPQQLNVLGGTALASGLGLGINTSGGITNWLTVEPPTSAPPLGDLKMVCPPAQAWCAMFITDGPSLSGYPRPGFDLSAYKTLIVEIEGDIGTTIQIGIKDTTQPDDGTEPKKSLTVPATWTSFAIPLSTFAPTDLKNIYMPCEFVFPGGAQSQTVRVRTITYTTAVVPAILPGGVVPVYSSASTIQSGSWVSIYGTNLASGNATWNGDFPTLLGGTSVTINNKPAYLWFVSPGQINLQAPDDTATGTVSVAVTTAVGTASSTVTLGQFGPSFSLLDAKHVAGIILRNDGSGAYAGGTYDIIGPTGSSLGYKTIAAKTGDTIALFGVGFGPTINSVPAGEPFSGSVLASNKVQFVINGNSVTVPYAAITGPGLFQFNLTLPAGLGTGDVPLLGIVGGVQTPAGVVISLQ